MLKPAHYQWQALALISIFCGVAGSVSLKLADGLPSTIAVSIRSVTTVILIIVMSFALSGRLRLVFNRQTVSRSVIDGFAGFAVSLAVFELPISLLTSFLATIPAFATLFAIGFLKERPRPLVWLGIAGAFIGCIIILRPALEFSAYGVGLALLAIIGLAARDVYTRKVGKELDATTSVLMSLSFVVVISLILTPADSLVLPEWNAMKFALLAGCFGVGAGMLITLAHQHELVSRLAPLRFTSLLWALFLDWVIWGFLPDRTAWTGILITAASVFLVIHQTQGKFADRD